MSITKSNIQEKFDHFTSHWTPHVVAELNGQAIKIAKIKGDFIWHQHDDEDEMFWVVKGCMKIELQTKPWYYMKETSPLYLKALNTNPRQKMKPRY